MSKKTKTVGRVDHFQATILVGSPPKFQDFHGKTLVDLKSQIDKACGSPCTYRPDPNNAGVTFIYNVKTATATDGMGKDNASLPIGWLGSANVPYFLGGQEVMQAVSSDPAIAGTDTSEGADQDMIDALLGDSDREEVAS